MKKIAVIKYNAGNNFSVLCALSRLGYSAVVTDDPAQIKLADKVIFPGVGEASSAMAHLRLTGLDKVIASLSQPVLGICIGQQLLCSHSEEGDVDCIGIFDAQVKRFMANDDNLKIPHMGWNTVTDVRDGFLPEAVDGERVYYVHSYYVPIIDSTAAVTEYLVPFSAALHHNNFYATQFHPEKSGSVGEAIIKKFIEL